MAEEAVSGDSASPSHPAASGSIGCSVIPIVNKVQDIFAELGSSSKIDLPQIAVVGSQSSGKSSILEALVGRDFLPRGSDICTRRPLVLQLVHFHPRPDAAPGDVEWGEFLHIPGKRFYDFSGIQREIQAETNREAGVNKGVSDKQICLRIFSPNVLNITLIDLPGITKVPVGDQPSDIEARIRTMILSYIKQETCIILAVSSANVDLSNSDALQMARIADPDGSRTIGVITKLDIMDRGTNARNFLLGNVIPLQLGYVGVVNRGQQDINLNRSIRDALVNEEIFFQGQPAYVDLRHCCGIPKLAKKLNQILVQHIRSILPGLKTRIISQLVVVAKEHAAYEDVIKPKADQHVILLNILTKYCEAFTSMIEGKNEELLTTELYGRARIRYIFQSIFVKSLEKVDPCEDVSDEDIRMTIQNATGPKIALFSPEVSFGVLVRRQIGRLLDASLQCAKFIYDELIKMSHRCLPNELHRYPVLRKYMDEVLENFLQEGLQPAEIWITHHIKMEMDYINTSHPNFVGKSKAAEIARQQVKASILEASVSRPKEARPVSNHDRPGSAGSSSGNAPGWGILSIFCVSENKHRVKENKFKKSSTVLSHNVKHSLSMIQELPFIPKPSESQSKQEALDIFITKLLLKSYYDIVRTTIEETVPKAIMHFLVDHTKRELHNFFITKLYRESLFGDLLQESDDIVAKRETIRERIRILQQAYKMLNDLSLEAAALWRRTQS